MRRALPFVSVLTLIYLAGAVAALYLKDPQLERLLKERPGTLMAIYATSYLYFCFIFWMFDSGVHLIRHKLSRLLGVPIREVSRRSDYGLKDSSYYSWDVEGAGIWMPLIYFIEVLVYGGSVIVPVAGLALWGYYSFS